MKSTISDWLYGPFILMTVSYLLWYYLVIPFERTALSDVPFMASILFLPHFARVFAIWYFGYRAVFTIVAAQCLCYTLIKGYDKVELSVYWSIIVAALAVVAALWILNVLKVQQPASKANSSANWKGLLYLALLASFFNAIGTVLLRASEAGLEEITILVLRIMWGDTVSVFVGLIMLMTVFRLTRGIVNRESEN